MFKVEALKSKRFMVVNPDYRFKEEWLLQVSTLKKNSALDFIKYIDETYNDKVLILREWYTCEINKVFEGPAGLRLEFLDRKTANEYCKVLNAALESS